MLNKTCVLCKWTVKIYLLNSVSLKKNIKFKERRIDTTVQDALLYCCLRLQRLHYTNKNNAVCGGLLVHKSKIAQNKPVMKCTCMFLKSKIMKELK